MFYKWLLSLLLTFSVIVTMILVVVNWSFQRGFVSYVRQIETQQVVHTANLLAGEYLQHGSWQFLRNDGRHWPRLLEASAITVPSEMRQPPRPRTRGETGGVHAPQQPDLMAAMVPLAHRIVLVDNNWERVAGPSIPVSEDHWYPIRTNGKSVGWLGLQPTEIVSNQLARSFIDQQRTNLVWIMLAGLVLALLVAMVWARWFLNPIHRVMNAARQLAAGHYEVSVPVKGRNELSELAINFNHLARTLARNEQLRRQWIVDISHELRTPIAVLGGEVEAIIDGIRQPTPERMAALHGEIDALGKLVNDLHLLSLADQASLELTWAEIDLAGLVRDQIAHFRARMEQQDLALDTEIRGQVCLQADAHRLSQLVKNLLENSLRYTDPGGEVCVRLSAGDTLVVLEVLDSAPAVSEEDCEKIFDRLYRVDQSRSRALGGSGLGLAICREIVLAHGGTISANRSSMGGLAIRVELPRFGEPAGGS
ncbi:HAMP domain-containing protein [Marinobacter sp. F3R08]|nr:ATP-binding protein [Marinobacter sp. F3R08]MBU2952938.1 HAMP domain-containing protein [Marinobacter sp. F3R08]